MVISVQQVDDMSPCLMVLESQVVQMWLQNEENKKTKWEIAKIKKKVLSLLG